MADSWYTDDDLHWLDCLQSRALYDALDERLLPGLPTRLTHSVFCKFRKALLDKPQAEAAEAKFPNLVSKVADYMQLPATKQLLQAQLNVYPDFESMMSHRRKIPRNARYDGLPGEEPDAATGAICDDCAPCLTYLYGIGAIVPGHVSYSENGWALLAVAVKAHALRTMAPLIAQSGLDPGPFQPSRVLRRGEREMSILRLCAVEAPRREFFQCVMHWCDQFIAAEEPRVAAELDSSALYSLCKLGCVQIADWALQMKLNLGLVIRQKDGKCSWHAAVRKGHPALFSWLAEDPSVLALINHRDSQGRTPLIYAVELDGEVSVSWLLHRLLSSQIRSEGVSKALRKTALKAALFRHSAKSVLNFQRIWKHDAYKRDRHSAAITTQLCEAIITDLIECRARLEASQVCRRQHDEEWELLKDMAKRKCQILVKDSPAEIYRGDAHKNCVLRARKNDLEFLVLSLVDERLMNKWDDKTREVMLHVHFRSR